MKKIAILGSTGSIGTQTLDVVRANGDIEVAALSAGRNIKLLEAQIREFRPRIAAVWEETDAKALRTAVSIFRFRYRGRYGRIERDSSL